MTIVRLSDIMVDDDDIFLMSLEIGDLAGEINDQEAKILRELEELVVANANPIKELAKHIWRLDWYRVPPFLGSFVDANSSGNVSHHLTVIWRWQKQQGMLAFLGQPCPSCS